MENMQSSPNTARPIIVGAAIIVIAILGVVGVQALSKQKDTASKAATSSSSSSMSADAMMKKIESSTGDAMMKKTESSSADAMMKKEGAVMEKKMGTYTSYTKDDAESKKNQNRILFFNASWCPTCKATVKDIEANKSSIGEGIALISVDYDSNNDLKKQYGVTSQHTFVKIDADGNVIKKASGLDTVEKINQFAQS
jgi:thiol-disulfide isomerase/thioredoxin